MAVEMEWNRCDVLKNRSDHTVKFFEFDNFWVGGGGGGALPPKFRFLHYTDHVKIYKRVDDLKDSESLQSAADSISCSAEKWGQPLTANDTLSDGET